MKITILGSGLMGAALGRSWAAAGHHVTFCYSRSKAKLDRLARETGGSLAGDRHALRAAVAGADAILLAVHWSNVDDVLEQAGDVSGEIILNCCVPLDDANEHLVFGPVTSGAEELEKMVPKARWVHCLNTVPSEAFGPVRQARPTPAPQVVMYGRDADAKAAATQLISDAGFAPLDAGGPTTGRYVEPFAMLTAVLAYEQPGGSALTYRFEKL